ncbi:MAG: hypothetical protein LBS51_02035 [Oscillospiraceae bacterium]|jgi:hypothetical protein|nr:hypothetical protein [Oscillospiraceae bacterium]
MENIWDCVIKNLDGGDVLSNVHVKKIHKSFPVPSDFKIMWAVAENFGHHPSGIAITDKGIVIKADKTAVEAANTSKDKKKRQKYIYQIIPWDLFDPEDFSASISGGKVTIKYGDIRYSGFSSKAIHTFFKKCETERQQRDSIAEKAAAMAAVEIHTIGLDDIVFAAGRGADQSGSGHGEYAEKAGTILDNLAGQRAQHIGGDNAKDGPDKNVVIDGKQRPVQCKYHSTPTKSVGDCFHVNKETGKKEFRYFTLDKKPMMVEVPRDQYDKAIESMKRRIKNGEVLGVTDPEQAYEIIRKGKLTYKQALNLAKAGTFESLAYDTVTGAINCSFVFGITVLVTFGFAFASSKDFKKSIKAAASAGLQTFGISLASQILSTQIARTGLSKALMPTSDFIVSRLGYKAVQKIINSFRVLMGKSPIYGAAAAKSLSKALRSNAITAGITFLVCSVPDTYRISRNRMSAGQYLANMSSLLASIAGDVAAAIGTGLAAGKIAAAAGTAVSPGVGTALGFVGGTAGGFAAGFGASKIAKIVREDDREILLRIFNAVVMNTCFDYMLDEKEIDKFLKRISEDKECEKELKKIMKLLYGSKKQYADLEHLCEMAVRPIIAERKKITTAMEPDEEDLLVAISEVMEELADEKE